MFYRCCWHVCTGRVQSPVSLQDFLCSRLAIYHIRSLIPWRCSRLNVALFWCLWRELRTSMGWAPGHCLWTSRGPHDCICPGCPVIRQWILGRRRYKVVCRPQIDEMRRRSWRWTHSQVHRLPRVESMAPNLGHARIHVVLAVYIYIHISSVSEVWYHRFYPRQAVHLAVIEYIILFIPCTWQTHIPMLQSKAHVIRNTASRTQARYEIDSGTTIQINQLAAHIAARHTISFPSWHHINMSWIGWCW